MQRLFLVVTAVLLAACAPNPANNLPRNLPTSGGHPIVSVTGPAEGSPVTPSTPAVPKETGSRPQPGGRLAYVQGSTQKICQLVGETDREFNQPTVNQTGSRFGLAGNDLGNSFEYNGKLFFLFGDSIPTRTFNGRPNLQSDPPRTPENNDAIAFTTDTDISRCLKLTFTTDSIGAYKNPVVLNAQGQRAVTLGNYEVPLAGISDGGKMYVLFSTDREPGGFSTRSVVAESGDNANSFRYLYDFSKGPDGKFANIAIVPGNDGYLYFWGTQGGKLYRKSPPFLARKPIGSMGNPNGIGYLQAVNADGSPVFSSSQSDAEPLFHDSVVNGGQTQTSDCMGELGVEWNAFLKRWIMLYNCLNDTPLHPRGVYMRSAPQPWGPWSDAQTIFNPNADQGYCSFIHRAVNAQNPTPCDQLSDPGRESIYGGEYAPYFISRFTTGDAAGTTSTFYYTLSTWNPYTEVIMKTTVRSQAP